MRPTFVALLACLVLFGIGGCRSGRAGGVPRTLAAIARVGRADLHCERVDQALYVHPEVVQVRGCGRRQEYVFDVSHHPPIVRVELVAEGDMVCSASQLDVESPAPAVRSVRGCGRLARYDLVCAAASCHWTMTAHSGAWAGAERSTAAQFDVGWQLPPDVGAIHTPEGYDGLPTVDVPTPAATTDVPSPATTP